MGWKNVRDHYGIKHIVQIREGRIAVGTRYVHDLIRVEFNGTVAWGCLRPSRNDELARYHAEMTADLAKLRELIETPDTFAASLPVYTYDGGEIVEKQCEEYGWPNCTHDGEVMFDNTFSADKAKVVAWAKRDAELGVKFALESIEDAETRLAEIRLRHEQHKRDVAKLEADHPAIKQEQDGGR